MTGRPPKFTDAQVLAEVLRIHLQDRFGGRVGMRDHTMRRTLVKRGLLVRTSTRLVWKLTPAARAMLVDIPGSGISRSTSPTLTPDPKLTR